MISFQTLQPITLCYFVLGERLSFTWTAAKGFQHGTRGELHHTQAPALTSQLSRPSLPKKVITYIQSFYKINAHFVNNSHDNWGHGHWTSLGLNGEISIIFPC